VAFWFPGKKPKAKPEDPGATAPETALSEEAAPSPQVPGTAGEAAASLAAAKDAAASAWTALLVDAIRLASKERRLTALSELASRFPLPEELAEAFPGGPASALEQAPDAKDLRMLTGASETWYFSDLSMTGTWATYLMRLEEKDTLRLIADTVREESRTYPRPTDLRFFNDPPFSLSDRELREALGMMELRPEFADIKRSRASNGALYLYSSLHLVEALAESLTEWIEVGQRENP
jgi:hypothetical protein